MKKTVYSILTTLQRYDRDNQRNSHSAEVRENLQRESEFLLPAHKGNMETNDPQEGHFAPEEDTSNGVCAKAQPITEGETCLAAFVKCQSTPPISPLIKQVDTEKKTYDANYEAKNRIHEPIEILCTPAYGNDAETHCGAVVQETFDGSTHEKCDESNYHIDAASEFIAEASGVDTMLLSIDTQKNEDTTSEYNAACQVLSEIIDETMKRIEFEKTQRIRFEEEKDGVREYISEISNQSIVQAKAQLKVNFASPLESCRLYTPSPSVSMASTLDIQSETDMCESEQEILKQTTSSTDVKSENKPFDTQDQPSIASQDNYSDPAVYIDFSTAELNDGALSSVKNAKLRDAFKVESSLDQSNVISGQMNRISTIPATLMSEEKVEPNIRENSPSEEDQGQNCEEMINCGIVEIDNSSKTNNSYETMQITHKDCQIHYAAKQMLPKIEQDMISSSCDLFGSIDNQQNTFSANINPTAGVDLSSSSPQVSVILSCHGNEMENQKQSDNSDHVITLKSTEDLPAPGLAEKGFSVVNITEVEHIAHRSSDQSTKFVSSGELFSQSVECIPVNLLKSRSDYNADVEGISADPWEHNVSNPYFTEPHKEIVKLILDHPDTRCSPKTNCTTVQDKSTISPVVKPETATFQDKDSYLDNEHTNEPSINISLPEGEDGREGESRQLVHNRNNCDETLPKLHVPDNKGINQISEEKPPLTNPSHEKCHANREMDSKDGNENIGSKTTVNNTAQLHENPVTNESELHVVETSPGEEVRKIDENYVGENRLIYCHVGISAKDGIDCTSSEWPLTDGIMNVSYQGKQRPSNCYQAVNLKNQMTNEMCVSPMQIKGKELQTVPVGLSAVQENVLEGINSDFLHLTSMPSSKEELLPQVTVTLQSTEERLAKSIPLKLDQSSTDEFKCVETPSFATESENVFSTDQYGENKNCMLPEIQNSSSNSVTEESQVNTGSMASSDEVVLQGFQNRPVLSSPASDNDFSDSGISNSSQIRGEAIQGNFTGNRQLNEANISLQESPQSVHSSQYATDQAASEANQNIAIGSTSASNTEAEIEQLVNALVGTICDDLKTQETGKEALEKDDNTELSSPPQKMRKVDNELLPSTQNNEELEVERHLVVGTDGLQDVETYATDGDLKEQNDMNEHLPLKKRSVHSTWTESKDITSNEFQGNSIKGATNCDIDGFITYEQDKNFPMPSQPQYVLYDRHNLSSDDDDPELGQSTYFNSVMTSQPRYSLFDRECLNTDSRTALNSNEVARKLSLLRRPIVSANKGTSAAIDLKSDDQQVPAVSPANEVPSDHSSENITMYPKFPGTSKSI